MSDASEMTAVQQMTWGALKEYIGVGYTAAVDFASGGKDNFAIGIAHMEGQTVIVDVYTACRTPRPETIVRRC